MQLILNLGLWFRCHLKILFIFLALVAILFRGPYEEQVSEIMLNSGKQLRPQGYKTFLMLTQIEHEISTAHKN